MYSQLTTIIADQRRADLLAAAANSRRTAAMRGTGTARPTRTWRNVRRRPAVA